MSVKVPKLDKAIVAIAKRLMEMPPKPHENMKVRLAPAKKGRDSRGLAASSQP